LKVIVASDKCKREKEKLSVPLETMMMMVMQRRETY
jgi:hypothetical protein